MKRASVTGAIGFAAAAALLVVPGGTWGLFSDVAITPENRIGATTLELSAGGGTGADNLDFHFEDLLPGARRTATGTYRNIGGMAQDVWIMFPNADAPTDVEVHVTSNGTEIFSSPNLGASVLPRVFKLADHLPPGAVGSFSISFGYNTQLSANPTAPTATSLPYQVVATQPGITP